LVRIVECLDLDAFLPHVAMVSSVTLVDCGRIHSDGRKVFSLGDPNMLWKYEG